MKTLKTLGKAALAFSISASSAFAQQQQAPLQRPPQFVLLAFDGSLNLAFWKESRDFAKEMRAQGKEVKYTYFMSGVYFLAGSNRMEYDAPKHGRGKSAIGFGGEAENLPLRVEQVNKAIEEGHEMGSHANGHFDAGSEKWSEEDWRSEFAQFDHLIFDLFSINKVNPVRPQGWILKKQDIVGFRAPQLGMTKGLWPTLVDNNFKYDTSRSSEPTYWPEKGATGLWNFPLAEIRIVGTAKRTLSMDYNFYVTQSGGNERPENKELYQKQMLDSYLKYFQDNYNGNRAPVHIGHHFSKWNGGAYWEAMKSFMSTVCGLPEVKCVTYKEYMNWLENENKVQGRLASYRRGEFTKSKAVSLASRTDTQDLTVAVAAVPDRDSLSVSALAGSRKDMSQVTSRLSVNGKMIGGSEISMERIREALPAGSTAEITAHLINRQGIEVARSTQKLKDLGLTTERLEKQSLEQRAVLGDLPEAHLFEEDIVPANLD